MLQHNAVVVVGIDVCPAAVVAAFTNISSLLLLVFKLLMLLLQLLMVFQLLMLLCQLL